MKARYFAQNSYYLNSSFFNNSSFIKNASFRRLAYWLGRLRGYCHKWVLQIPSFTGTREQSNEGHLEMIQSSWVYEWRESHADDLEKDADEEAD